MYQRSTTQSRRRERIANTRWLHVSQWFKPVDVQNNGITTTVMQPQFTFDVPYGKGNLRAVAKGKTYNAGRNRFKAACRVIGRSRVRVERMLRAGQSVQEVMA